MASRAKKPQYIVVINARYPRPHPGPRVIHTGRHFGTARKIAQNMPMLGAFGIDWEGDGVVVQRIYEGTIYDPPEHCGLSVIYGLRRDRDSNMQEFFFDSYLARRHKMSRTVSFLKPSQPLP